MNDLENLIQRALAASENAYIPYSNYRVGAALLTADGVVYTGCNVENASYPATICAERTALVVVTSNNGTPCGICRQMLFEFAPDLNVIIADFDGNVHHEATLRDLLPHGFGPSKLGE